MAHARALQLGRRRNFLCGMYSFQKMNIILSTMKAISNSTAIMPKNE
jgi:hypothetical protein